MQTLWPIRIIMVCHRAPKKVAIRQTNFVDHYVPVLQHPLVVATPFWFFGVFHAYYFGQHNYDYHSVDSSFGQGYVRRGGVYADRVDDDKYGAHIEIDNNRNCYAKSGAKIFT